MIRTQTHPNYRLRRSDGGELRMEFLDRLWRSWRRVPLDARAVTETLSVQLLPQQIRPLQDNEALAAIEEAIDLLDRDQTQLAEIRAELGRQASSLLAARWRARKSGS